MVEHRRAAGVVIEGSSELAIDLDVRPVALETDAWHVSILANGTPIAPTPDSSTTLARHRVSVRAIEVDGTLEGDQLTSTHPIPNVHVQLTVEPAE